jgi:DNA-binding transcriptional MerR regulator
MRIGELARRSGVSTRALRYYEEQGLLVSERSSGGQRTYRESDVDRIALLQSLYTAGIPSRTIAEILPCVDAPSADHAVYAWSRMMEQRDRISENIAALQRTRDALDGVLARHRAWQATRPAPERARYDAASPTPVAQE